MIKAKFVNGKKETPCADDLAQALDAVFGDGNNDKDKAAGILAQIWNEVTKQVGQFEKVVIETSVTRMVKGEAIEYPATIEVLNLNLDAVLSGVVEINRVMDEARRKVEAQKALYKQARNITIHGYEAGKRGRTASNQFASLLTKYGNTTAK